ncbi:PEP-CTERM sorting domain-containing protein [Tunturibacter psychrotolerans]|uniref:PEP-CTERM sorting domain-containing protein n=1 Tax=Tunturiibacter psychrotolerans TaxID=3069686 RepID=A0AAU7ZKL9_9BACT
MRRKIGLLILFSTLATSNIAGHADTYNFIITTAATTTSQGAHLDIGDPLTGRPAPRIPSAIDLTGVTGSGQEYGFTSIVLFGTDHTNAYNELLYTHPIAKHVDSEKDLLYLDSSVGINLAHVYDNDGYHMEVFDPHDSVDIAPFTIGFFRLIPIAIPEPSSLMLLGIGILSLAAIARRRFRRLELPR